MLENYKKHTNTMKLFEKLSNLSPKRDSINVDENSNVQLSINIINYDYLESDFQNQELKLTLQGYLNNREFTVERTLDELWQYRQLLVINYPGFPIPKVDLYSLAVSSSTSFMKVRKILIKNFLNKIASIEVLAGSKETFFFLNSKSESFLETLEVFRKEPISILDNYKVIFPMLMKEELTSDHLDSIKVFYNKMINLKDFLDVVCSFSTKSQNTKIEVNKNMELFYQYLFDYNNNFVLKSFNVKDVHKFNKPVVECKHTENLYETNFEDSFYTLFEWVNSEILDCEMLVELLDTVFEYDRKCIEKLSSLKSLQYKLESTINPGITSYFTPINYKYVQELCVEIEASKEELNSYFTFSQLLYKIVIFIIIPTYNQEKKANHSMLKSYISDLQISRLEKETNIANLIKDHVSSLKTLIN